MAAVDWAVGVVNYPAMHVSPDELAVAIKGRGSRRGAFSGLRLTIIFRDHQRGELQRLREDHSQSSSVPFLFGNLTGAIILDTAGAGCRFSDTTIYVGRAEEYALLATASN